jgi:hypothetical protein
MNIVELVPIVLFPVSPLVIIQEKVSTIAASIKFTAVFYSTNRANLVRRLDFRRIDQGGNDGSNGSCNFHIISPPVHRSYKLMNIDE